MMTLTFHFASSPLRHLDPQEAHRLDDKRLVDDGQHVCLSSGQNVSHFSVLIIAKSTAKPKLSVCKAT